MSTKTACQLASRRIQFVVLEKPDGYCLWHTLYLAEVLPTERALRARVCVWGGGGEAFVHGTCDHNLSYQGMIVKTGLCFLFRVSVTTSWPISV